MSAKLNEKTNGKSQISGWNLARLKFKGVKAILSSFKSLSALMDQILPLIWPYLLRLELPHHFQCRVPHRNNSPFGLLQMKRLFSLQHSVRFQLFFKISTPLFSWTILHMLSRWTETEMSNDSPLFHTYPPFWCRYANPIQTEVRFASLKAMSWTNFISFSFDMLTRSPPNPKHPLTAVDQAKLRG